MSTETQTGFLFEFLWRYSLRSDKLTYVMLLALINNLELLKIYQLTHAV